ncbi:hypothetical protein NMY22_g9557 [Coprinellus aureogranulatus]|nr:hypothetical protein NMY22_g9557 [Coprinellus aureogranulatus]
MELPIYRRNEHDVQELQVLCLVLPSLRRRSRATSIVVLSLDRVYERPRLWLVRPKVDDLRPTDRGQDKE